MTEREKFEAWWEQHRAITPYNRPEKYHWMNCWQTAIASLQPPENVREAMRKFKERGNVGNAHLNTISRWAIDTFAET